MFDLIPRKNQPEVVKERTLPSLFDSFFNDMWNFGQFANTSFRVDVKETAAAYQLEADLPGISKEDITLEYTNDYLTITAKREAKQAADEHGLIRQERYFGAFQRSFYLDNINADSIQAEYKDGVLKVNLPKKEESISTRRQIEIH
ncbi:MAG: Hsp20/alpha crystallin family protein [Pelosinus sp.]|nr:Hsp20/alpha crystallin family protein [Pelosinus sp.]